MNPAAHPSLNPPPNLAGVDLESLRALLSGLTEAPPRRTLKSVVRDLLPEIRRSRARGVGLAEIAARLAAGGCPVRPDTLRKYLQQLEVSRKSRKPRPGQAPAPVPKAVRSRCAPRPEVRPSGEAEASPDTSRPRRSLRRTTLVNSSEADHG